MSSLEKFAKFANPDKLLMVGEVKSPPFILNLASLLTVVKGVGRH